MKLGPRLTVTTAALVMVALGVFGFVSVRIRRAELVANLEQQTQSLGNALQVALEAALREGLFEDVRKLVARIAEAERPIGITYLELHPPPLPAAALPTDGGASDGGAPIVAAAAAATADDSGGGGDDDETKYVPPPPDPGRDDRVRRILIDEKPLGEHVEQEGRMLYAYALPLHDDQGRVVAAIDLTRDESDAERALAATQQNVALTVCAVGVVLGLLVWLSTRRGISHPLQRLVEGIDEVSKGDVTGVILKESEDEIGELAERFNAMTASLREARVETQRGLETKLALETKLRHSEKLATIGQLAAAIAHEVGTPLNVIGGRARTMEKKASDPAEVSKNAAIIAAQATRIARIIQRLLDYARKKVTVRDRVDAQAVMRDTLDFLEQKLASSGVNVNMRAFTKESGEGVPETPEVFADADELQQVCLNLCMNAIQAMPRGGAIDVTTRGLLRRKPGLDLAPPGRYVLLEVRDHGVGIPPEDRERIFEPFYSTKQDGGTGLGLAVSLGIVKDHDGWIDVDAGPGGGTIFRVYLPAPEIAEEDGQG
jgi:signal transduction histidine kinase